MPQGDDPADHAGPFEAKPLNAEIREHLGRRLRSTYTIEAEKPAYLGDPAIPPQFERLVLQLEGRDRSSLEGLRAVGEALGVSDDASGTNESPVGPVRQR